jgi:hypothetical protein
MMQNIENIAFLLTPIFFLCGECILLSIALYHWKIGIKFTPGKSTLILSIFSSILCQLFLLFIIDRFSKAEEMDHERITIFVLLSIIDIVKTHHLGFNHAFMWFQFLKTAILWIIFFTIKVSHRLNNVDGIDIFK